MLKISAKRLNAILVSWIGATAVTAAVTAVVFFIYLIFLLISGLDTGSADLGNAITGILFILLISMFAGTFAALYSLCAFGIGLIIFSVPAWWALHKMKLTNPLAFTLTGAGLSVTGGFLVMPQLLPLTPLLAMPGGVAGWLIWYLGYERP